MKLPGGVTTACAMTTKSCTERAAIITSRAPSNSLLVIISLPATIVLRPESSPPVSLNRRTSRFQAPSTEHAVRIDANDHVAGELLGVFPLVRRASRNDEDVTLRNRDILGT